MLKNKKLLIYALVFAVLVVATDLCYMLVDCSAYITKTIASLTFVIFGVINLLLVWKKEDFNQLKKFTLFMVIGLVFACLGDIFLIEDSLFMVGAILFAIGHIFYLVAFILLSKYTWIDVMCSLWIFIASALVLILYPYFDFGGMKIIVYIYALVISFMLGKALGNYIKQPKNLKMLLLFIGAFLFFFSDLMLVFNVFANAPKVLDILCLATYYPGEYLLALAILVGKDEVVCNNQKKLDKKDLEK